MTYANIIQRGPDVPANPIPFPGFGSPAATFNAGNTASVTEDDGSDDEDEENDDDEDDEDEEDDNDEDDEEDVDGDDGDASSSSAFETMA